VVTSPSCKLSPEVENKILEVLREGNFREVAARAAGITGRTLKRWMAAGKDEPEGPFGAFHRAVLEAEKDAEEKAVRTIRAAGEKDWRALAFFLERRFPERWGRRDPRIELTGKNGAPIEMEMLHGLTDEERIARISSLLGLEQLRSGGDGALAEPAAAQRALPAVIGEAAVDAVAGPADAGAREQG